MKRLVILILTLSVVLSLCACIDPEATTVPTQPTTLPATAPGETEPTVQEDISLIMLRQQMIETPAMFAIAYLGFVHEPSKGTVDRLLEDTCPEMLEAYPFMAQIPAERLLGGTTGELYLIVPRDSGSAVQVGKLLDEEYGQAEPSTQVIYQAQTGEPFLLIANGGDFYPDHQLIITEEAGLQVTCYIYRDEMGYVNLPIGGDVELALDITYKGGEYDTLKDWMKAGWIMPDETMLYSTGWHFEDYTTGQPITYLLELTEDGFASLYSYYAWESECLEEYQGIWYCHIDGDYRYLNLSMERVGGSLARPDEIPVSIVDCFPVLIHYDETALLLGMGLYECELPFVTDGEITAVFEASAG